LTKEQEEADQDWNELRWGKQGARLTISVLSPNPIGSFSWLK
jgi:hypothetical protein